jgi:hypothetical protein
MSGLWWLRSIECLPAVLILSAIQRQIKRLLESIESEDPDFDLIDLPQAAELPVVKRKPQNLASRASPKRTADLARLVDAFRRTEQGEIRLDVFALAVPASELSDGGQALGMERFALPGLPKVIVGLNAQPCESPLVS